MFFYQSPSPDLKFQPTCCPSRKGSFQWFRSVRPYYSGDKPYRYLTGFPKTKGIKSDFRYSVIKVQKKSPPNGRESNVQIELHSYPSHYSIPFEYHYKNTVNCRLNTLRGTYTLFGILTQQFFNRYRSNKLYVCLSVCII